MASIHRDSVHLDLRGPLVHDRPGRSRVRDFAPSAHASPLDEDDAEDEEHVAAAPDPGPPRPETGPSAPCNVVIELAAPVRLDVTAEGGAIATLPLSAGVARWRLEATLYYADLRGSWTVEAEPGTEVALVVPTELHLDAAQDEWLSSVRVRATGLGDDGTPGPRVALAPAWVVWDEGTSGPARWLDAADKAELAPRGAWSAVVTSPEQADIAVEEIAPPRSAP